MNDPGCDNPNDSNENQPSQCANGLDDDGDGFTDLNDADCNSIGDDRELASQPSAAARRKPGAPLVLLVEDLHHADAESVQLLTRCRRLDALPVAAVLSPLRRPSRRPPFESGQQLHGRRLPRRSRPAGHEDYRPAAATPQDIRIFEQTLAILAATPATRQLWFFSHRPVWYDLIAPEKQPNALQAVLRRGLSDRLQVAFGGHQHTFSTLNFARDADPAAHPNGRPAQVIVGGGGTQLESLDPRSPFFEAPGRGTERTAPDGRLYDGVKAISGIVLNRYSFLLLERDGEGWNGTVLDPDGRAITRCTLPPGGREFNCAYPNH